MKVCRFAWLCSFLSFCSVFLFCCVGIFFTGCDMGTKTSESVTPQEQKDLYEFKDPKSKEIFQLSLKTFDDGVQIQSVFDSHKNDILEGSTIKLLAFFPNDCQICMPMFTHLSNLTSRVKSLRIIVLNEGELESFKSYKEFFIISPLQLRMLQSSNGSFTFLLDSLKRKLNIEIRDFRMPFFLLLDHNDVIIRSYEGVVLEEIFEKDVMELLGDE